MDERDFELLAALDQTHNITHAADLLYVSQSSLSKRIGAIEQELDITLLIRSRQGVHFTPEGEEVLKHTTKAASQLKIMRASLDASKDHICGTLNAGISINYAFYRLPEVLTLYRKQYPHVNMHITTDQSRKLYLQVLDGSIDVAVIRGEYLWKGSKILLDRERICVICSLADQEKRLQDIPHIGRKTDTVFEREIAQWMREHDLMPDKQGICVDTITTCVEMVNRGLGWAIVPEICLRDFKGCVRPLYFANGEPFVRSTYLMFYDDVLSLPQVEAFIHMVKGRKDQEDSYVRL